LSVLCIKLLLDDSTHGLVPLGEAGITQGRQFFRRLDPQQVTHLPDGGCPELLEESLAAQNNRIDVIIHSASLPSETSFETLGVTAFSSLYIRL
jgi:hypothetical protein